MIITTFDPIRRVVTAENTITESRVSCSFQTWSEMRYHIFDLPPMSYCRECKHIHSGTNHYDVRDYLLGEYR